MSKTYTNQIPSDDFTDFLDDRIASIVPDVEQMCRDGLKRRRLTPTVIAEVASDLVEGWIEDHGHTRDDEKRYEAYWWRLRWARMSSASHLRLLRSLARY